MVRSPWTSSWENESKLLRTPILFKQGVNSVAQADLQVRSPCLCLLIHGIQAQATTNLGSILNLFPTVTKAVKQLILKYIISLHIHKNLNKNSSVPNSCRATQGYYFSNTTWVTALFRILGPTAFNSDSKARTQVTVFLGLWLGTEVIQILQYEGPQSQQETD